MILNSRNNLFDFRFPSNFIPEEVAEKYKDYLHKIPGTLLENPIDFINYSIQAINLPGITFDPVSQSDNDGTTRYHRGKIPIQNTVDRQFSVTLQLLDGYINYWIMLDTLLYYYAEQTREKYTPDMKLRILDAEGLGVASISFEKPILNQISELNLSMSENVAEFNTFTMNFYYNKFSIKIDID
tara:strand:- start:12333 stop:12884 length:552 start_codon:yes stop_codon:yes gene_type:complete